MPFSYDRKAFFDAVRDSVFRGSLTASQVAGMTAILDGWERLQPNGDTRFIAYMLGTAAWETARTMQPVEEYGHGRGRAYGAPAGPWHQVYDGRGDVQLTWEPNYRKATLRLRALGVLTADEDLERTPALAMRPDVAAAIMFYGMMEGWFTGKKLATYFNAETDWVNARRIINGTDQAEAIAAIAQHFFAALKTSMVFNKHIAVPREVKPAAADTPPPAASPASPAPAPGLFGFLAAVIARR